MKSAAMYEMTDADFERFRGLINRSSGIFFDRSQRDLLCHGVAGRAKSLGARSLEEYYQRLTDTPGRENELKYLLDNLLIQKTRFFNNLPQFDALCLHIIPEIMRRKAEGFRKLRLWSVGCSTGQEAYSMAMSVLDVLPDPHSWDIQILGTDLSETALEVAGRGIYSPAQLIGVDRLHRDRYFSKQENGYRVTQPMRQLVHFMHHNIVTDQLPVDYFGACDVVFCRNVVIYFNHPTARFVIDHFFDILNPGGYLFLGHSETLWKMSAKYSLVEMGDAFMYRKSLPRSIDGRRFIPDRRMRIAPLPAGVKDDRRQGDCRRRKRLENQAQSDWQNRK